MKTVQSTNKTIGLGAFLALALAIIVLSACAGPAQYWTNATPITTTKEAAAVKPHDTILMVCGACETVDLVDAVYGRSPSSEIDQYGYEWLKVGYTHKCDHCGGEITIVRGKTADSMQHNCSMCGEGAAFCCAAPAADGQK